MNKVQITLTDQEATLLSEYGKQLGYGLSKTVKFLVGKAAEERLSYRVPTYKLSEELEQKGLDALEESRRGKTTEIKDFEEFFSK